MATDPDRATDEPIYMIEIGRREVVSLSVYGVVLAFLSLAAVVAVVDAHSGSVASALILLVAFVATIIVHELVHGLLFALFGGSPSYGAGITHGLPYACATSPGDRFQPHQMYVIAAAPLVLITAAALTVGVLVPDLAAAAVVVVVANVSGAVVDLWMMTRMRAFTSRAAVTFEDTRAGLAVYGHDPEALVVAGELRAAKESARPRYVVAALGATMVLMLVAVVVPSALAALGTSSDVVIGADWFSLVDYRPAADGFEVQFNFLPSILGGIIFSLVYGRLRTSRTKRSTCTSWRPGGGV